MSNLQPQVSTCLKPSVSWKKTHNLKAEKYFLLGRLSEDLGPEDSLSGSSQGLLRRGKGGVRINRSFGNKHQKDDRWRWLAENQTSQVNELSAFLAFLHMWRYKRLGSSKSFLWDAS